MTTRTRTLTDKVSTQFGALYVHVDHIDSEIHGVAFSSPGKFFETSVGTALDSLGQAATQLIQAAKGSGDLNVR